MCQWMTDHQQGRGAKSDLDYLQDATYMSGLPYLMYVFARELPEQRELVGGGDQELDFIRELVHQAGDPAISLVANWEVLTWSMMSYAERLRPEAHFRMRPDN